VDSERPLLTFQITMYYSLFVQVSETFENLDDIARD